ncbi:glycosyltransferase [Pontibacter harenae]|uniref:glycosyltransferase n=1 Tax=Pontibacter harenae TaxID=2894083 RepID=UPI001E513C95|nr:glycosyltransferase [Pontibacter harenae]MCC9168228.1 glycosyltransferase [Pontibacter harenae]
MQQINHVVLSTHYKHHSELGGYDQLAKYTEPTAIIGINEHTPPNMLLRKYKWVYEYIAKYKFNPQVVHIYYAEEYLRFSPYLFSNIPVVATFHQPPENLEQEVVYGDYSGRIGKITHSITKGRFNKLAAAIILEENQRAVLEKVMPKEKIHLIPHGIHPSLFKGYAAEQEKKHILTVGNWQRNWELYEEVLSRFLQSKPYLKFVLVNRSLPDDILTKLNKYQNFKYTREVSDSELEYFYRTAYCLFLPLSSATANNSLIESLVYGCPVVTSSVFSSNYPFKGNYISFEQTLDDFVNQINSFVLLTEKQRHDIATTALQDVSIIKWPQIAEQVLQLYISVAKPKIIL